MPKKEVLDIRDEILNKLKEIERPLSWLSKKTEIPYPTLYSVFKQRIFNLSDENKQKINKALDTNY